MEVKPHEQIVIKVDGSRRLMVRNRRFVRKLDHGKTSLRNHTPGQRRMRHYVETSPLWSPSQPTIIKPPQPTPPETTDQLPRNTETPKAEVLLPVQNDDGADQHHDEEEDQVRYVPVVETTPVGHQDARRIRQKKPNMRYPANVFNLSLVGTKSRRTPKRAE